MSGLAQKVSSAEEISHAEAQRRKALPRLLEFRCAVAALREKYSLDLGPDATFVQSNDEERLICNQMSYGPAPSPPRY